MLKNKAFAIVAACTLAAPALVSAQQVGSVGYLLNYARDYLAKGQNTSAVGYAKEALALDPTNAEALAIIRQGEGSRPPETAVAARQQPNPASNSAAVSGSQEVGSVGYFLDYARRFMNEGKFSSAASYAKDALNVDPGNAEARAIIEAARQRKAPDTASAAVRAPGGDPKQVGTPAYFLQYAKHHYANGLYSGAVAYAEKALAVDPNYAEAKQLLALARGRADKGGPKNSCEAQFSTCWSSAMTYTPGSGYSADNARRQMCFVERNICSASR